MAAGGYAVEYHSKRRVGQVGDLEAGPDGGQVRGGRPTGNEHQVGELRRGEGIVGIRTSAVSRVTAALRGGCRACPTFSVSGSSRLGRTVARTDGGLAGQADPAGRNPARVNINSWLRLR